jgi:antitoxin ParD1/3/4
MGVPRNTAVTLGEHFDAFIHEKIAQGRFQSVSETVRAGLRRLEEDELKLEALRAKLAAGEASPLVEDFSPRAFLADMRAKHGR